MVYQSKSAKQTSDLARKLIKLIKVKDINVICLYGELGSGKTTLTQSIAKELGITAKVISPTFVLVRRYDINPKHENRNSKQILNSNLENFKIISNFDIRISNFRFLWHIDLYRLSHIDEIRVIGIEELIADKNNLVVIEWPEKIIDLLPQKRVEIFIKQTSDKEREIEVKV